MQSVSAEKMKTMAAVLRDPNPLHWDREAVNAIPLNLGRRTINQGPLGLSYIVNMLHAWMGPRSLRRLVMRFPQVVLDDDKVFAKGIITALNDDNGELLAQCRVSLEHELRGVLLEGEATILLPQSATSR
ncbi:MAG: acyl dehydratase [Halioglobus sp.]|jgi:acyl dehydratase